MVARLNHISNPWGSTFDTSGMSFLNIAHSPLDVQNLQKTQEANDLDRFALPADGKIEHLIDHYFSDVGLLFPHLHKPTFLDCYTQMKRDRPINTRRIWLGILNMVLAVGSLTVMRGDSMAQDRALEAQKYYERAASLCDTIVLSGTSLEVGKKPTISRTFSTYNQTYDLLQSNISFSLPTISRRHALPFRQATPWVWQSVPLSALVCTLDKRL